MFGSRWPRFEEVKDASTPGLFNPARWCAAQFDDVRFSAMRRYKGEAIKTHLDWSAYPAPGRIQGRDRDVQQQRLPQTGSGVMCRAIASPATRRRDAWPANTLRLALTAARADALAPTRWRTQAVRLLQACGVNADRRRHARMKIEVAAARRQRGLTLHDWLVAICRAMRRPRPPAVARQPARHERAGGAPRNDWPVFRRGAACPVAFRHLL